MFLDEGVNGNIGQKFALEGPSHQ